MKILVLGGHGFVGKNFIRALKDSPHTILPLSRQDSLDLTDRSLTKEYFQEIQADAIVNCAAHVGSLHYVAANAADVLNDNVMMALNIYRAVKDVCPNARVINPLSNCSYPGDAEIHYEPDWWNGPVHNSVYSYGNAKRLIYVASYCYAKQYGIKTINFLVPNTFGPGDYTDPNRTHALNGIIIRMIKAKRAAETEFEIWGTGTPVREWAYIDDVVNILIEGLTMEKDMIYPVNIAQNHGYSIKESAELIAKALNYKGKLVFNSKYEDGAPMKILDNRQFAEIFPDYKFVDHEVGIRKTVEYYESVL